MLLLALLFVLAAPPQGQAADCDRLAAESDRLRDRIDPANPGRDLALIQRLTERSREARLCYERTPGGATHDSLMIYANREVWGRIQLQQYLSALRVSEAVLRLYPDAPASSRWYMYRQQGDANVFLRRYRESAQAYAEARLLTPPDAHSDLATLHIAQADVYEHLHQFDEAEYHLGAAHRLLSRIEGRSTGDQRLLAQIPLYTADLYLAQVESASDRSLAARALTLAVEGEQAAKSLSDLTLQVLARLHRAEALTYLGRSAEAEPLIRETVALADLSDSARRTIAVRHVLARVLLAQERYDEAEAWALDALAQADQHEDNSYRRRITSLLGALHERRGRWAEAERWYRRAILSVEESRRSLGATDWSMSAFAGWQEPYRGAARVLIHQGRVEEALCQLDRMQARHLRDLQAQARLFEQLPDAAALRVDSLTVAYEGVLRQLRLAPRGASHDSLQAAADHLLVALDKTFGSDLVDPELDVARLQQSLAAEGSVLIAYLIGDTSMWSGQGTPSFAFVIRADTVAAFPLDINQEGARRLLAQTSPVLTEGAAALSMSNLQFDLRPLHELHERLLAPARDLIPEGARLVVVPDASLFALPFGMLVRGPTRRFDFAEADYLLRSHPVSVELAPSLYTYEAETQNAAPADGPDVIAFGRATFGEAAVDEPPEPLLRGFPETPLPSVARELRSISRLFEYSDVALDAEATEEGLLARADGARIIHLASHAIVDPISPLYNALLLTESAADDGVLHLYELKYRSLPAELVVLSACNTARGEQQMGEGMRGLQHAFRSIGVRSTMATLWPSADEVAPLLTRVFYRHLIDGAPKDVALQQAQLAVLASSEAHANPFFWAAPVLYGDPASLALRGRASVWPYWIGALLMTLVLAIALSRYYHRRPHARAVPV